MRLYKFTNMHVQQYNIINGSISLQSIDYNIVQDIIIIAF